MKPKNITLDDLARMVQDGFAHTDEKFTEVNKHFDQIDQRFNQVDERFVQMDGQFAQVHQELRAIRKELEGVVYRPEFEALQDQVNDLKHVLAILKKKAA